MAVKSKTRHSFTVELEREDDGRWIAEIPKLPGVMAYGATKQEAVRQAHAIALRTLADSVEHGNTA
ncbi:MAG: type II toxin-antitoxin system HicB family antitoxin [Parcubacteria group bacterium]|nr:type II toxin-antitoxin system HicB family antitoxin [Parcubacteria group bacterium]